MSMEQFKCGEIYRDGDGKVLYTCLECQADFVSAVDFEDHLPMHYEHMNDEEITLIKIETLDQEDLEEIQNEPDMIENGDAFAGEIEVLEEYDTDYDKLVKCICCDEYYACRGLMKQHLRTTEDEDKKCDECPAYFENKTELIAHRLIHDQDSLFPCHHCCEVFGTDGALEDHLNPQNQPNKPSTRKRKRDEKPSIDDSKSRGKYSCDICSKEYTYIHYLKEHLKKHSNNTLLHTCETCGHEFKLRQNLLAHQRIHTGEKPYTCKLCNKSFNQPYYMTVHMRIHQKEKPYQCSLCGVSFVTSSHLGRHMKSHNNVKPHKCNRCEKAFILPGHLHDHIRSQHTGERPFHCEVCGNTFSRRKLLRQHMQLHGEKRFKCKYCNLAFAQSAGRRGHEIRAHSAS